MTTPAASLAYCRAVTRRAKSSFPLAFRVLPPAKRDAMTALYAFFRLTDDLADGPGEPDAKRAALADWRTGFHAALAGTDSHPIHPAVRAAVTRFGVPPEHIDAVISGAETDLEPVRYPTFDALYPYCYRVASAVGLACVHVWGFRTPADRGPALELAEQAGIAFQLTNILRDVGEDHRVGRVYLPADDLARFGCPPETWADPASRPAFQSMMRFQADRARDFYRRADPLADHLTPDGRAIFGVMAGLYQRLLDEVERRDFAVFGDRIRVGKLSKARIFLAAWPVKWGWR
ncbi:MAG: phytoene/squalene synthase family protein [Fimbriiglobus sp.]